MARLAQIVVLLAWTVLAAAGTAQAAETLTAGDLGWLRGNLNLAGDSPALLVLSETQKTRLHALIADSRAGIDKKRQNVVGFLTGVMAGDFDRTLDESITPLKGPTRLGADQPR